MPKYGKRSLQVLSELNPTLQTVFKTVIEFQDLALITGWRGEKEQNAAFNAKPQLSKKKFPFSKHNRTPSDAVDADPYPLKAGRAGANQSVYLAGYIQGVSDMLFKMGEIKRRTRNLGQTSLGDWRHTETF